MSQKQPENLSDKITRLMVFNVKGGVGKTSIALNFALTHGYGIITNDRATIINQVLPEEQHIILSPDTDIPEMTADIPVIFDFGGYPDQRALDAIKQSQFIIIPILPYRENIKTNLDFIKEIQKYKQDKEIIVIANDTTKGSATLIKEAMIRYYPQIKIFEIKRSAVFAWMTEQKKSIHELADQKGPHARHFKVVAKQFEQIFNHLEGASK